MPDADSRSAADAARGSDADVTLAVSHDVTAGPAAGATTRTLVRETLSTWRVADAVANAALDVTHELVCNALTHGAPPVVVTLERSPSQLVVRVTDGSSDPARRLAYRPGVSERGLGLRLVAQLADEWGQGPTTAGKQVWAKFRVATRPPASTAPVRAKPRRRRRAR
jgi:two-component sensor histidine kinase